MSDIALDHINKVSVGFAVNPAVLIAVAMDASSVLQWTLFAVQTCGLLVQAVTSICIMRRIQKRIDELDEELM